MDTKDLYLIRELVEKTVNTALAGLYVEIESLLKENKKVDDKFKKIVLEKLVKLDSRKIVQEAPVFKKPTYLNGNKNTTNGLVQQIHEEVSQITNKNSPKRVLSRNAALNEILNDVTPFETDGLSEVPELTETEFVASDALLNQNLVVGADNQIFEATEETKKVLDLANMDFSGTLRKMKQSADLTRRSQVETY